MKVKRCNVSVIIPNRDRTSLLARALNSVANQSCVPSEVIVIDDCSRADLWNKIRAIVDSFSRSLNIKLLRNTQNLGANACRNQGIAAASSRYAAFLDSDDMWLPDKLKIQMAAIEDASITDRYILSSTGRYRVDEGGTIIARQYPRSSFTPAKIRTGNLIGTLSSVVVDIETARLVSGFDEELPSCQDWDFYIRVGHHARHVSVSDPLCVYVEHQQDRISSSSRKRVLGLFRIYRKHILGHGDAVGPLSQFYRNIAEEFQLLGKQRKASQFYLQSVACAEGPAGVVPMWIRTLLVGAYYKILPIPSFREERYAKYREQLATMKIDADLDREIAIHQQTIHNMMRSFELDQDAKARLTDREKTPGTGSLPEPDAKETDAGLD